MNQMYSIAVVTSGPLAEHPILLILLLVVIVVYSLLCVEAALLWEGEMLKHSGMMLTCQLYLVMTAFLQLSITGTVASQVVGFLMFALGIASLFFRKNNFRAARYCIAAGATVAACGVLLM